MGLSHRITHLTEDATGGWEIFFRARQMMAEGVEITNLTIGEHDIRTDGTILDAMHAAAHGGHTGYADIPGTPALRQKIAEIVSHATGVATKIENVMVTPGGQSALFSAHMAVCDPGDTALYVDPFYATYPGTLRGAGAHAVIVPAHAEDGFQPRIEAIEAAVAGARDAGPGRVASLLINTPNNPTGAVYSAETLQGIARAAMGHDFWVISDEVYDTQVWQGQHLSIRSLPGMAERTLVVGSMSKSHVMTGSRIGWIVGPEEAVAHLTNLATHTTYGVAGFIQDAALFALEQGAAFEEKIAAPFRRRREIALSALKGQALIKASPPQGAMYVMLDIRATGLSGRDFAARLLDECRIAVMPGESFGASAAGHVRVAMTVEDGAFGRAVERIAGFAADIAQED